MSASDYSSSDHEETEQSLVRHSDLWFVDGSIVLRAENTLFRVHMSQLSRRSAFFRDLFSLPQPATRLLPSVADSDALDELDVSSQSTMLEGCPVLHLQDAAEDLSCTLKALYDGPNLGTNDREDFQVVSGILRISTKYIIDSLRAKALEHLSIAWPLTLKGWDAREDLAHAYELEHASHRGHLYPSPIAVINLAREIDAPELLPSAFYDLSRYHFTQIFEPGDDEPLGPASLSLSDMQKLALGKEASQHAVTGLIQSMASGTHRESALPPHLAMVHNRRRSSGQICVSAGACRKDFAELVDLATQHYLFDRERGCSDPLYVAEELGQLKSAEFSECKACAKSLEAWAARERERMWKLIPSWFRLDAYGLGSRTRDVSLEHEPKVEQRRSGQSSLRLIPRR
ncbi:hypothetical protein BKA93DRAFT_895291 [Sparassis latifolia]|uniref:BTB domain-containing protein n=1 Tax=Sparassis crispa TaxID=139825 RepID=A0A401GVG4_9APHY|nr:hypothetical protein SCP_0900840 [Sparassis crispa]GBE86205.1 hypothetical protein SCP_0900840 [Sparassis crispa]